MAPRFIVLHPGAGHLSSDDGYEPWPAVESWARQGRPAPERAGEHHAADALDRLSDVTVLVSGKT